MSQEQEPPDADGTTPNSGPPVSRPPVTRKLDLASGQRPRAGFEGVDIWPGAQHVVDLQRYPWPFEDESVLELNCSHYLEHIPMEMIDMTMECPACGGIGVLSSDRDCNVCFGALAVPTGKTKDALFAFFDECWRILVPDGWMHIVVPSHRSDRAFQDPTHRRFITQQTFVYLNEQWRRDNGLDHYNVMCNFHGEAQGTISTDLAMRHPDVVSKEMNKWNTVVDWVAKIQKKQLLPPRG